MEATPWYHDPAQCDDRWSAGDRHDPEVVVVARRGAEVATITGGETVVWEYLSPDVAAWWWQVEVADLADRDGDRG